MKICRFFLFVFLAQLLAISALAKTDASGFKTPQDLVQSNSLSNIYLRNNTGSSATVYGLYVRQFSFVTPGQSCDSADIMYSASENKTAGAVVMPVIIHSKNNAPIGANYLYNLIYGAIFYMHMIHSSFPPGCSLPGCSWGSDATHYHWCIYLGALAPVMTSADYTSNVPPATDTASTDAYNYNLVNTYGYIGPISCDDQTQACTVDNPQTQSFP